MAGSVIVGYGTKRGSTREVAEAVGAALRDHGLEVEVEPARKVKDIARYDGVVLGGALYNGRWHQDARRFLRRHRKRLAGKPFAVFAMGPRKPGEDRLARSRKQLARALEKAPRVVPVSTACFGGVDRARRVDLRDWAAIRVWGDEVANGLGLAAGVGTAIDIADAGETHALVDEPALQPGEGDSAQ